MIETHPLFKEASSSSLRAYYDGWLAANCCLIEQQAARQRELAAILETRLGKFRQPTWS